MIKRYEKFRIEDENKRREFYAEVNWNDKDEKSNNCKLLKFTFPNGDTAVVKKEYLNAILFAIGTEEEQRKLIPQKIQRVKEIEGWFKVKANKDVHKGEELVFPYKLSVPTAEDEVIGDLTKFYKNKIHA